MTAALPANITYGTVTGRFITAIGDTAGDVDALPEAVSAAGTITFTPQTSYAMDYSAGVVIIPKPVIAVLDSQGYLTSPGNTAIRAVTLVASDNAALNPQNWTYTVTFNLAGVTLPSFDLQIKGGTQIDLATYTPVPTSAGVSVIGYDGGTF